MFRKMKADPLHLHEQLSGLFYPIRDFRFSVLREQDQAHPLNLMPGNDQSRRFELQFLCLLLLEVSFLILICK